MPSAFPSDDRCLGGADLIMRQYVHAVNSKEDARPTVSRCSCSCSVLAPGRSPAVCRTSPCHAPGCSGLSSRPTRQYGRHLRRHCPQTGKPCMLLAGTCMPGPKIHAELSCVLNCRAAKRAAINNEMTEHARNVYHLNRRIENAYSVTERRKNPYDPIMFPAHQKRSTNFYRNSLHNSMMAWIPGCV